MTLQKHMPALDGLRGVAVLLVILRHVVEGWPSAREVVAETEGWPRSFTIPDWLYRIGEASGHGVQLFFVISAFTLTIRALRNREDDLRFYALRRVARVGPAYWLAAIGYTLVAGLGPRTLAPNGTSLSDLAIAAGFGSAWDGGASLAVVPGGWSVGCEISFYIALPLLVRVIDGRIWRAFLLLGAATFAAVLKGFLAGGAGGFAGLVNLVAQAPVFLCGVTAAVIAQQVKMPRLPGIALLLLAAAIFAIPFTPIHHLQHLQFAPLVAIVVALAAASPPGILASRPMHKLGEVSYSLYLVHFALLAPSLSLAEWLIPADDWRTMALHFAVTAAASFCVSCLTYAVIERPAIRWASRLGRRETAAVTNVASEPATVAGA